MDKLKHDLNQLNDSIKELENRIIEAEREAQNNVKPLNQELSKLKEDKRQYASKNDFDSVQECIRKESNLKFKISAQWNKHSLLKEDLVKLNKKKHVLESKIKLEEDKIKRRDEILSQMNLVLDNYKKSQNLRQAAIDSNIHPDHVKQWFEWGKNNFNETYAYFYTQILEIDNYFKKLEGEKLKKQMDSVVEAYKKTNSLKEACKLADVSYDTVQYWCKWGSMGFGEENIYFYKCIRELK